MCAAISAMHSCSSRPCSSNALARFAQVTASGGPLQLQRAGTGTLAYAVQHGIVSQQMRSWASNKPSRCMCRLLTQRL